MKVVIKVFGKLLDVFPRHIEMEFTQPVALHELISKYVEKFAPSTQKMFYDPKTTTLINGRNILTLMGFDTPLSDGDVVSFMPFVVGG
ncbi:MAG: MoaD/ThiS family protein [Candidatus Bathyarchaeota archaeon]|nr:MAG: MoaD/ThiS family protein [Candidatus Bathyarchaeota archaeon]